MARFILIDNFSGYIWGDSADLGGAVFSTDDPIEYARALDCSINQEPRTYTMQRRPNAGTDAGYLVYRADIDGAEAVPVVHDGQDQDTIDAVTGSCRYVGFLAAGETKMTAQYFTISPTGRAEIAAFISRYHKHAADQRLDAWVADAEARIADSSDGRHGTIEIPFFDALSGHTEALTLEGDALTAHGVTE